MRRTQFYIDALASRGGTVRGYVIAVIAVAAATALELVIYPYVGNARYVTFLIPVIITAMVGRLGASLFCLALSIGAIHIFLVKPGFSLYDELAAMPALGLFILTGLSSIVLITEMRSAIECKSLAEDSARLQLALDTAKLGWWHYDPRRLVASGDTRCKETFDITEDEISAEGLRDRVHPDDAESFWLDYAKMLDPTGPEHFTYEYRVQRRDGEVRWLRVSWLARRDGAGRDRRVVDVVGTVLDITDHKLAQRSRELDEKNQQLRQANTELTAAYDQGLLASHLNTEGRIVHANRACVEDLGFERADIIGKRLWEAGYWRTLPAAQESLRKMVEIAVAGEASRAEVSYITGDGEERVGDIAMTPIRDDAGRVVSVCCHGMDITERARQYQVTFENATVGIVHATNDLRWGRVNDAMARIVGYPANELIKKPVLDVMHPDFHDAALADVERLRAGIADSYIAERQYLRKDGTSVWVRANVSILRKSDGSIAHFVGVIEDISARKRAEELLRRQADLLDQSHDAILTIRISDRSIVFWNRGAERLYGYTAAEAEGRRPDELLQSRSTIPVKDILAELIHRGSWDGELTQTTRDGRDIVVESRFVRVSYDGEMFALETSRDISERKRDEEELRKSEERFRLSIIRSPVPTLLFDDRELILAVSGSWLKAAGLSADELHRIEDWARIAYGERSDQMMEFGRQVRAAKPEARVDERMIRTRSGTERLWQYVTSYLGIDRDGRHLFVSVAQDVTDLRAYEERIELLMREARHRTKNVLGVVQVIARQTAARKPEDFIDSFSERLQALAANQDVLVKNQWHGADVEDVVRGQLAPYAELVDTRITVHGPKMRLNAAAAQAVGLAVHELATNASKYGALSTDGGRVNVDWRSDDGHFAMKWTERDGPPVSPPVHKGFGSTVIESMVKSAVDGEVELDYDRSGFEWHLTCPTANALEAKADMRMSDNRSREIA